VLLADHFLEKYAQETGKSIRRLSSPVIDMLMSYHWPGNVRELKNHVRRAVLFCKNGVLTPNNLAAQFRRAARETSQGEDLGKSPGSPGDSLYEQVAACERQIIERAVREHGNNRSAAARALGMSRVGLYKKMKRHGMIVSREEIIADAG
jgi:Nif-specific regulatory protein